MQTLYFQTKTNKQYCMELTDGNITQFFFQTASQFTVGDLISGVIKDIDPRIKAAFIRVGGGETAYMPLKNTSGNYHQGMRLILKVEKNATSSKRMTVSDRVELTSDSIIYFPNEKTIKLSSNIHPSKSQHLNELFAGWLDEAEGVLLRTAAQHEPETQLKQVLEQLRQEWKKLKNNASESLGVIKKQSYSWTKHIQENSHRIDRVICDDLDFSKQLKTTYPEMKDIIKYEHNFYVNRPFTFMQLKEQLTKRRIKLPSEAELVIDRTEAMTVIDVNSAQSKMNQSTERLYLKINEEAATAVIEQIRLRHLSGMILIDFINLKKKQDQERLTNDLKNKLKDTRLPIHVYGLTRLGLMELSSKRVTENIYDFFEMSGESSRSYLHSQLEDELLTYQAERVECLSLVTTRENVATLKEIAIQLHEKHQFSYSLFIHSDPALQKSFQLYKIGDSDWLIRQLESDGKPVDKLF